MQEKYFGYLLFPELRPRSRDGVECCVIVEPEGALYATEQIFYEHTFISGPVVRIKYRNYSNETIGDNIVEHTLSKARARLVLGNFEKGGEYKEEITTSSLRSQKIIADDVIQKWFLTGLLNMRKKFPIEYENKKIDLIGFCALFGINKEQLFFNIGLLSEDKCVKIIYEELSFENSRIIITSTGINYLELLNKKNKILTNEDVNSTSTENYEFDVAITFAGEERKIAEDLANELKSKNIMIFYDQFEKANLWGKNLYDHFSYVYNRAARFCIMIISENYARKAWTNLERQNAQARAFRENKEYILPIRLDDTEIPGLTETIGYITLKDFSLSDIAELVYKKLIITK